jgi:hypothetical protein
LIAEQSAHLIGAGHGTAGIDVVKVATLFKNVKAEAIVNVGVILTCKLDATEQGVRAHRQLTLLARKPKLGHGGDLCGVGETRELYADGILVTNQQCRDLPLVDRGKLLVRTVNLSALIGEKKVAIKVGDLKKLGDVVVFLSVYSPNSSPTAAAS